MRRTASGAAIEAGDDGGGIVRFDDAVLMGSFVNCARPELASGGGGAIEIEITCGTLGDGSLLAGDHVLRGLAFGHAKVVQHAETERLLNHAILALGRGSLREGGADGQREVQEW